MNSEKKTTENQIERFAASESASVEDFLKQLEAKEKDLHISPDLVVEIEESDIAETDSLELLRFLDSLQEADPTPKPAQAFAPVETDYAAFNENREQVGQMTVELSKLREQVSKFETERVEISKLAARRQNDFDNYRKRIERERSEMRRNLLSNVASEILPVLDNLNRALDLASTQSGEKTKDYQQFVDGIGLVNHQLNEVLGEMGIEPIISIGEPFDPNLHEAVAAEGSDRYPPNTVIAEMLRGYRLDDKVIRHSLVKVSTATNSETE